MKPFQLQSRREMLTRSALGFGSVALAELLHHDLRAAEGNYHDLRKRDPHFKPQVKSVILMMQNGGPSQRDLFDPKKTKNDFLARRYDILTHF